MVYVGRPGQPPPTRCGRVGGEDCEVLSAKLPRVDLSAAPAATIASPVSAQHHVPLLGQITTQEPGASRRPYTTAGRRWLTPTMIYEPTNEYQKVGMILMTWSCSRGSRGIFDFHEGAGLNNPVPTRDGTE